MSASITLDQTLLSLFLSLLAAAVAYRAAAHVLRRQESLRELRARRDALRHVLMAAEKVADYLEEPEGTEYPQREMLELERCALQAQIHYAGDLELQKALRGMSYPNQSRAAAGTIRKALEALESRIAAG